MQLKPEKRHRMRRSKEIWNKEDIQRKDLEYVKIEPLKGKEGLFHLTFYARNDNAGVGQVLLVTKSQLESFRKAVNHVLGFEKIEREREFLESLESVD